MSKRIIEELEKLSEQSDVDVLLAYVEKNDLLLYNILPSPNFIVIKILENKFTPERIKNHIMILLEKYGIFLDSTNSKGQFALHICFENNYSSLYTFFQHQKDNQDSYGKVPAMYLQAKTYTKPSVKNESDPFALKDMVLSSEFTLPLEEISEYVKYIDVFNADMNLEDVNSSLTDLYNLYKDLSEKKSLAFDIDIKKQMWKFTKWEEVHKCFWKELIETNITAKFNKYESTKNYISSPIFNNFLINRIRRSIIMGHLPKRYDTVDNFVNLKETEILRIIRDVDLRITHPKAVLPRYNIIDFDKGYFIKGHNYMEILPLERHLGDLTYDLFITKFNYYNFKNWFVLRLFRRYDKNISRIVDHFSKNLGVYYPGILERTRYLNWRELFWFLISLPFSIYDVKSRFGDDLTNEEYKDIESFTEELDVGCGANEYPATDFFYETTVNSYLQCFDSEELKYMKIKFGMEIVILFKYLECGTFSKKISKSPLLDNWREYDKSLKNKYVSMKDVHVRKVLQYDIKDERKESCFLNMNQLLPCLDDYNDMKDMCDFLTQKMFYNDDKILRFLRKEDYCDIDIQKNSISEIGFANIVIKKVNFLLYITGSGLSMSKIEADKESIDNIQVDKILFYLNNLITNLSEIKEIFDVYNDEKNIEESVTEVVKILNLNSRFYPLLKKFYSLELEPPIKYGILCSIFLLVDLWDKSLGQFHVCEDTFQNVVLDLLYKEVVALNFPFSTVRSWDSKIIKKLKENSISVEEVENLIFTFIDRDKYYVIYFILTNLDTLVASIVGLGTELWRYSMIASLLINIYNTFLRKDSIFEIDINSYIRRFNEKKKTSFFHPIDIIPVFLYLILFPHIFLDILNTEKNIKKIIETLLGIEISEKSIGTIIDFSKEIKYLFYDTFDMYYVNTSFLNILLYSIAVTLKMCVEIIKRADISDEERSGILKTYYDYLSRYESELHNHEFILMFNDSDNDVSLFLNHMSAFNMSRNQLYSVLTKIYGVHPSRQRIISEVVSGVERVTDDSNINVMDQVDLQQTFYGVFMAECLGLEYMDNTFSSLYHTITTKGYEIFKEPSNLFGEKIINCNFEIDYVVSNEDDQGLEKSGRIVQYYTPLKLNLNDGEKIVDVAIDNSGQFIYVCSPTNIFISHNYGYNFEKIRNDYTNVKRIETSNGGKRVSLFFDANIYESENYGKTFIIRQNELCQFRDDLYSYKKPNFDLLYLDHINKYSRMSLFGYLWYGETFGNKDWNLLEKNNGIDELNNLFYILLKMMKVYKCDNDKDISKDLFLLSFQDNDELRMEDLDSKIFVLKMVDLHNFIQDPNYAPFFFEKDLLYFDNKYSTKRIIYTILNYAYTILKDNSPEELVRIPYYLYLGDQNLQEVHDFVITRINEFMGKDDVKQKLLEYLKLNNQFKKLEEDIGYMGNFEINVNLNIGTEDVKYCTEICAFQVSMRKSSISDLMIIFVIIYITIQLQEFIGLGEEEVKEFQKKILKNLLKDMFFVQNLTNLISEFFYQDDSNNLITKLIEFLNNPGIDKNYYFTIHNNPIIDAVKKIIETVDNISNDDRDDGSDFTNWNKLYISRYDLNPSFKGIFFKRIPLFYEKSEDNINNSISYKINLKETSRRYLKCMNYKYSDNIDISEGQIQKWIIRKISFKGLNNQECNNPDQREDGDNDLYRLDDEENVDEEDDEEKVDEGDERNVMGNVFKENIFSAVCVSNISGDNGIVHLEIITLKKCTREIFNKHVIYRNCSNVKHDTVKNISFSLNGESILLSNNRVICISYDYGKSWDVSYLVPKESFIIYSNLRSNNKQTIILYRNGRIEYIERTTSTVSNSALDIILKGGQDEYDTRDSHENIVYKSFMNMPDNKKVYYYKEFNMDKSFENDIKSCIDKGKICDIVVKGNIYDNRILFCDGEFVKLFTNHLNYYDEKLPIMKEGRKETGKKKEQVPVIIVKKDPDINVYIAGSRIDTPLAVITDRIKRNLSRVDGYIELYFMLLKGNYPNQKSNFIYLYSVFIEEIKHILQNIELWSSLIPGEKDHYESLIRRLYNYIIGTNVLISNTSYSVFNVNIKNDMVRSVNNDIFLLDKSIVADLIRYLETSLGIMNLYHFLENPGKNNFYITREIVKSNFISYTFHALKSVNKSETCVDILNYIDIYRGYHREKELHALITNIKKRDKKYVYTKASEKISEVIERKSDTLIYNSFIRSNKYFLLDTPYVESVKDFSLDEGVSTDTWSWEYKTIAVVPDVFMTNRIKWDFESDIEYYDNWITQQIIDFDVPGILSNEVMRILVNKFNHGLFCMLYKSFGYTIDQTAAKSYVYDKEQDIREKYLNAILDLCNERGGHYRDFCIIYINIISGQSDVLQMFEKEFIEETVLNFEWSIFRDLRVLKQDSDNLIIYNLFPYKLSESDVGTIEFLDYASDKYKDRFEVLQNFIGDIRNILVSLMRVQIVLNRLCAMASI